MATSRKTPAAGKAAKTAVKRTRPGAARKRPAAPAPAAPHSRPEAAAKALGKAVTAAKPDKAKKPKLVRDSFTIPKAEYAVLDQLKLRAAKAGAPAKKSEILRAGIKALAALGDAAFVAALRAVPAIKTGRPAKQ